MHPADVCSAHIPDVPTQLQHPFWLQVGLPRCLIPCTLGQQDGEEVPEASVTVAALDPAALHGYNQQNTDSNRP